MKKYIFPVIVVLILGISAILLFGNPGDKVIMSNDKVEVSGDLENQQLQEPLGEIEDAQNEPFDLSAVIGECDSLCQVDSDAYCEELRTIEIDGEEVVGTCRAFSKERIAPGFDRCEGFCNSYPRSTSELV